MPTSTQLNRIAIEQFLLNWEQQDVIKSTIYNEITIISPNDIERPNISCKDIQLLPHASDEVKALINAGKTEELYELYQAQGYLAYYEDNELFDIEDKLIRFKWLKENLCYVEAITMHDMTESWQIVCKDIIAQFEDEKQAVKRYKYCNTIADVERLARLFPVKYAFNYELEYDFELEEMETESAYDPRQLNVY